jgi:hypothetical protein
LILDFSFSNWIFFINRALISKKIYCQISIFVFFNLLNQLDSPASSSHCYYFLVFFWIYFFIFSLFLRGDPKIENNTINEHSHSISSNFLPCYHTKPMWWLGFISIFQQFFFFFCLISFLWWFRLLRGFRNRFGPRLVDRALGG